MMSAHCDLDIKSIKIASIKNIILKILYTIVYHIRRHIEKITTLNGQIISKFGDEIVQFMILNFIFTEACH